MKKEYYQTWAFYRDLFVKQVADNQIEEASRKSATKFFSRWKEYYQAKADLCRDLAIKQMVEGNAKEAGTNLIRMVNALNELEHLKIKEERASETDEVL
jgi:hypothetical protein